ncbi:MAG: alpha-1,4-glucan--maltose-1-phosphate maltosyltransferase [Deltaproteobacteria bacterium]|nr:alpha-1,4-glucan--maltose-1-phosphate maltosyltransferase [Deltaproteobacteria bacterium]
MQTSGAGTDGRRRVLIEHVRPEIDGGRFPIKRVVGDRVDIEADVFVDGHDVLAVRLLYAEEGAPFVEVPMVARGNDVFAASFAVPRCGRYRYTVEAWVDAFATFRHGLMKKVAAGQDVRVELLDGGRLVAAAAARAAGEDQHLLAALARELEGELGTMQERAARVLDEPIAAAIARHPDRSLSPRHARELSVVVDPPEARFSSWYEFFPRSCGRDAHGTFADAERMIPYVVELGFDVIYLPPIHPIGVQYRKGRNNTLVAGPGDPGSPWAIGAAEGGHTAVHPSLGTVADFERFVRAANEAGIEVAIDIAFQASPDHPWVKEHPEWFHERADGSIQYAENPPKKYQDVYPFAFDGDAWLPLWDALRDVFLFWVRRGVHVFRVDNPHTKPLSFWEWCLAEVKRIEPRAVFLAEAFTRPKVMLGLAKRGFSQSYTYFTWRTTKTELETYLGQVTGGDAAEVMRPNFWPNTPDILPEELQHGGRPAFLRRAVLAATMSSNWGIYGPAFELMEHVPRPGSEEYLDNEKFELKRWDLDRSDSLRHVIARLNRIRRENPALQANRNVAVHRTDDDFVVAFSKRSDDGESIVLTVVLLDGHHPHGCWLDLDLAALGVADDETFQVHDLLGDGRWQWHGRRAYVHLDPRVMPAQVFRVRKFVRNETGFEYYT